MGFTDAFQLFHIKTSKTSLKLYSCIKINYCFFTRLWPPADLRGTRASGQKSWLTLSYKPHHDPLHEMAEKETPFSLQYALFFTDMACNPSFPHGCKQEVAHLPKNPFPN